MSRSSAAPVATLLLLLWGIAACAVAADGAAAASGSPTPFYWNSVTGESRWERPAEMPFKDGAGELYWLVDGEPTRSPPTDWAWVEGTSDDEEVWWGELRSPLTPLA